MQQLEVIKSQDVLGKQFQVYGDFENPLFLAKDIAAFIDYGKTGNGAYDVSRMTGTVDDEEKLVRTIFLSGQRREVTMLTEDGLYEVLMQSRKPIAKAFKKEVKRILRELRTTGQVQMSNRLQSSNDEQLAIIKEQMAIMKQLTTALLAANQRIEKPKAQKKPTASTDKKWVYQTNTSTKKTRNFGSWRSPAEYQKSAKIIITYQGQKFTLKELADIEEVSYGTVYSRYKRGWTPKQLCHAYDAIPC